MTEKTQEMSPHPVKLPASDAMTEDQQREVIGKCRTQKEAAVALGLSPKSIGSVAKRCKALGPAPPWAKDKKSGRAFLAAMIGAEVARGEPKTTTASLLDQVDIPRMKITPKPDALAARRRELEAKAEADKDKPWLGKEVQTYPPSRAFETPVSPALEALQSVGAIVDILVALDPKVRPIVLDYARRMASV